MLHEAGGREADVTKEGRTHVAIVERRIGTAVLAVNADNCLGFMLYEG